LSKVQTGSFTVSNRVFYKERKAGACNIIDVSMISFHLRDKKIC